MAFIKVGERARGRNEIVRQFLRTSSQNEVRKGKNASICRRYGIRRPKNGGGRGAAERGTPFRPGSPGDALRVNPPAASGRRPPGPGSRNASRGRTTRRPKMRAQPPPEEWLRPGPAGNPAVRPSHSGGRHHDPRHGRRHCPWGRWPARSPAGSGRRSSGFGSWR